MGSNGERRSETVESAATTLCAFARSSCVIWDDPEALAATHRRALRNYPDDAFVIDAAYEFLVAASGQAIPRDADVGGGLEGW